MNQQHPPSGPKTLLLRFVSALARRDVAAAMSVLATAGERRALPRRLLFGHAFDRTCRQPQRTAALLPITHACSEKG